MAHDIVAILAARIQNGTRNSGDDHQHSSQPAAKSRTASNLRRRRTPFLLLGSCIRKLRPQHEQNGSLGHVDIVSL